MRAENKYNFDGQMYDLLLIVWAQGHRGRQFKGQQKEFLKTTGVSSSSINRWKKKDQIGKASLKELLEGFGLTWNDRHWLIADGKGQANEPTEEDKIDAIYRFIEKQKSNPTLFVN